MKSFFKLKYNQKNLISTVFNNKMNNILLLNEQFKYLKTTHS